ncbi:hypothetical protein PIB30_057656 [Stylosanthes scabra]|uniref:Uncharacterized protein n=1 Tax=Stylosanthes scabra TaxID=79078 RepID=A0ABU6ZIH1_9FABA|nr:hypothetical protein [Stylosanthes scabra]
MFYAGDLERASPRMQVLGLAMKRMDTRWPELGTVGGAPPCPALPSTVALHLHSATPLCPLHSCRCAHVVLGAPRLDCSVAVALGTPLSSVHSSVGSAVRVLLGAPSFLPLQHTPLPPPFHPHLLSLSRASLPPFLPLQLRHPCNSAAVCNLASSAVPPLLLDIPPNNSNDANMGEAGNCDVIGDSNQHMNEDVEEKHGAVNDEDGEDDDDVDAMENEFQF